MNIIVSSKHLPQVIKSVLKHKPRKVIFHGELKKLEFYSFEDKDMESIYVFCEFYPDTKQVINADVDPLQWYKIRQFTKQLPEQPISIGVEAFNEGEIRIRLKQFIMDF